MALAALPPGVVILTSSEQLKIYDQLVRATLTGAEDQLVSLFRVLNFEDIPLSREEMKRFLSSLVDAYGPALTQGALDWYQELRPAYKTVYTPKALIPADSAERIDRLSRYAAGLGHDNPGRAIRVVAGAIGREIQTGARRSILRAADLDPSAPRFARVPVGKTCAFCTLLASRGWVYHSKDLAGGAGHEYHDSCDCRIVPDWEHKALPGYHPDDMYAAYLSARRAAVKDGVKAPSGRIITAYMRDGHPEMFSDGQGVDRPSRALRSRRLEKLAASREKENSNEQEG